eukprot:CAMPEP_0181189688 /NCGR_PEP_ID=MMETSP1096-20121128/11793_1 /TAXON_ID=156174 ORGANISM="Chrysochromulina ericina, Strain CCMP281" /NCGR_SAMPLE_ID=MMETSP1096 /ASSEMBLY_ACC=CAM_ASM_000453 /LENGTH=231 /DNA_ID=CAMNT_0023278853 /DNA_START=23 /DNA_END=718 /DNA_ORIENTATION=-
MTTTSAAPSAVCPTSTAPACYGSTRPGRGRLTKPTACCVAAAPSASFGQVHDSSPSGRKRFRSAAAHYPFLGPVDHEWFSRAMSASDFCYSPLGQRHGDSDRYLPAILYGCIPVFIKEEEAGPFDEIINWSLVSLQLRPRHVPVMHHVLQNISAQQVVRMRMAMASIWKPLLWTRGRRSSGHPKQASFGRLKESVPPPSGYLGEDGQGDAFTTLMQVLRLRLSRECNGTTI